MSTIISSCPPTSPRRPTSSRICSHIHAIPARRRLGGRYAMAAPSLRLLTRTLWTVREKGNATVSWAHPLEPLPAAVAGGRMPNESHT
jgi:hypothetical protein